jgi:hypothetical protein
VFAFSLFIGNHLIAMSTEGAIDALALYARAGETGDVDLLLSAYAPDGALHSPIVGRFVFRGADDLRRLMTEVYRVAQQSTFTRRALDGDVGMLTGTSRVWGFRIEEAFAFDLDERGRIRTATVHIRPLLGLMVFAVALGLRMTRHPGLLWRAWRG